MQLPPLILPEREVVEKMADGEHSYSLYNYYGSGPIASAKRRRFRLALKMGESVAANRAIDMGCADGLLLPTLSKLYEHVAAIEVSQKYQERCQRLMEGLGITNVDTICNRDVPIEELQAKIGDSYGVMYLLETLEHIGKKSNIWAPKKEFLNDCFKLLEPGGQIIISVPKMVGMIMLFKNVLQRSLGMGYDEMTWSQLWRSSVFNDTDELEDLWDGRHVGFNHLKLDKLLEENFVIHERRESAISVFYRIAALTA